MSVTFTGMRAVAIAAALALAIPACGGDSSPEVSADPVDAGGAPSYSVGWLGGRVHPTAQAVELPPGADESGTRVVGGLVVTEVAAGAPLARTGVARGDVIVRAGERWVPNKEDPTLDLLAAIEAEVSAATDPLELCVLRDGNVERLPLAHGRIPLEIGLPGPSERIEAMARAGVEWLVARESAGSRDMDVATTALVGLALVAAGVEEGEDEEGAALARWRARVEAAVAEESSELGAWSLAFATSFLAELAGPLDVPVITLAAASSGEGPAGMVRTEGLPEGAMVFSMEGGELPEGLDLEEILAGSTQLGEGGEGGEPGMQVMIATGGPPPPGFVPAADGEPATEEEQIDGPLWTPEQVEALAGEGTAARLAPLAAAVERLLALQHEDGGWDADGAGYSDATLATNQALLALGAAERAGVSAPGEALRSALAFVRERTNDGHVFAVEAPGFDRRREAGRAAGAAAALRALRCRETDEFLRELSEYSDRHGASIAGGGGPVLLHLANTAVLRRQRGLGSWAGFFEDFRTVLVALQEPDGSFAAWPGEPGGSAVEELLADEVARTALGTLVLALQSDRAPVLLARAQNPLQTPMTSEGQRTRNPLPAAGLPFDLEGAEVQVFTGENSEWIQNLEKRIQEPDGDD